MRSPTKHLVPSLLAVAFAASILWVAPADAARPEEHCVIHVLDRRADGELVTTDPVCSSTRPSEARLLSMELAVHYEHAGFLGSSLTVSGSDCNGGWMNLPPSWQNRISSTQNRCPVVRHYDGLNLTGAMQATTGTGGNLSTLNELAESVQYTS